MDDVDANTVRLLLSITPVVFPNDIYAMKGGTAINLFVRDMPRLSVDIDVVYTPWQHPREQAMTVIAAELNAIAGRVARLGLTARTVQSRDLGDTKLLIENESSQVKVEVNVVLRGQRAADRAPSPDGQDCQDVQRRIRSYLRPRSSTAASWSPRWIASIRAICSMYGRCSSRTD